MREDAQVKDDHLTEMSDYRLLLDMKHQQTC